MTTPSDDEHDGPQAPAEVLARPAVGVAAPRKRGAKPRGFGRVYERNGWWWIQYHFRGELHRESSGSQVEAVAVRLLKKRHGEMGAGRLVGPEVEKTTFEDMAKMLIDDYRINGRKSLDRAVLSVRHLRDVFGLARALDITTDAVSGYMSERLKTAKPATVRLELAALKRMFTLAQRAGKVVHRPHLPTIEVRNTRRGFFEADHLQAVLAQLPPDERVLIEFVALTGWRIGEAKGLKWRNVDFNAGMVHLDPGTTKNDEARTFPFAVLPRLHELLREHRDHTRALERQHARVIEFVFHRAGRPIRSFRVTWTGACARAGVPGLLVHDLRRTAVRNLERAGVSRSVAMKLTGHKTESVYRRYAIVNEADMADGVRKLALMYAADGDQRMMAVGAGDISRTSTKPAQIRKGGLKVQPRPNP